MKTRTKILLASLLLVVAALAAAITIGFRPSTHPTKPSSLGVVSDASKMEALIDVPGPLTAETIVGAQWQVDRSGLINLDHPKAKAAGLVDGLEPIQVNVHVVRHPTRGVFLIDSGIEKALRDDPEHAAIRGPVAKFMKIEKMVVEHDTASVVAAEGGKIAGVLLTHLHLDHVSGLQDVPKGTPIYAGPGETATRDFLHAFVQGSTDRALAGHEPIEELAFSADASETFDGVLDLFGDGSLFAIWVPGHTAGSVAYLARTTSGPVLFVGDACHTKWGWENEVEPGSFSHDRPRSAESLKKLEGLVKKHPRIDVRLGHQSLGGAPS